MRLLIFAWAVLGVVSFLSAAVLRLLPMALEPLSGPLEPIHVIAYLLSVGFMAYSEGYRGFQKQFSPRVVARARGLAERRHPLWSLLAPVVAMGLLHATRKRLIVSWAITLGVVGLVVLVRKLDQPWRGVVDAGVVIGLSWGIVAILVFWGQSLLGAPPAIAADFPGEAPPQKQTE